MIHPPFHHGRHKQCKLPCSFAEKHGLEQGFAARGLMRPRSSVLPTSASSSPVPPPPVLRNGGHLIFLRYTANIDFSLGRQPSSYGAAPPTAVLLKQTLPRPALRANLSPLRTRLRALSVRLLSRRVPAADPLHHYPTAPYRRTRPQPETLTQDLRFVSILALAPPSSPLQYTLHYNL